MIRIDAYKDSKGNRYVAYLLEERPLLPESEPRYCACGNELTPAERDTGETVCEECR